MTKPWRSESSNRNAPLVRGRHATGRIVGRTHVHELRARPHCRGNVVPRGSEATVRAARVDAIGRRAREQCRALVDLVERIRHHDRRADAARVDDRLREREQRLAAAEHRQHLRRRIEWRQRRVAARASRRSPRAAPARPPSWDNSRGRNRRPPSRRARVLASDASARRSTSRSAGSAGFGVTPANSCRSRSNGYGDSRERRGFKSARGGGRTPHECRGSAPCAL